MISRYDGIYCDMSCQIEIIEDGAIITGININEVLSIENYFELVRNGFIEIID